ncbi:16062_t:CDS:2 [Funneliformis geosporum]|uniref:16062_t:CDS:1 n=1 Tax=Funneliformis geosporum TaxID=1117311 RepID=A0A9W4SMB7_9GLOM|nr:16062_t:CDS:2 [Funneliformis geosporum]
MTILNKVSSSKNKSNNGKSGDNEDFNIFENYVSSNYKLFQDPPNLELIIDSQFL